MAASSILAADTISVIIYVTENQKKALSVCSEFSDTYGFDANDLKTLVIYLPKEFTNEIKNMLNTLGYKLFSFQTYGSDTLMNFIPKN